MIVDGMKFSSMEKRLSAPCFVHENMNFNFVFFIAHLRGWIMNVKQGIQHRADCGE